MDTEKVKEYPDRDTALDLVTMELERQDNLWGTPASQDQTPEKRLAILVEEVGEYAKEVLEHRPKEALEELVQVAAVAIANIERYLAGVETK